MNAEPATARDPGPAAASSGRSRPYWNVLVTAQPAPRAMHELLEALHLFGEFRATPFHDACAGYVKDVPTFLDALLEAQAAGRHWTKHLARAVPISTTFDFAPDAFAGKLESAVDEVGGRIDSGTFMVRVERRGLPDAIQTTEIEREVAERLSRAGEARAKALRLAQSDPDYVVAVETLGAECGVALLTRTQRQRYPFVRVR